ncbi:hypothetical protein FPV67DRAFT_1394420, partial [Lyophyllum atratum]
GLFEMLDGDIIFGRNLQGPHKEGEGPDPENDVILAWCCDGYVCAVLSPEMLADLKMVQEIVLGDRDSRTPDKPTRTRDGYQGGVAYERQEITGVKDTRCYSVGPTHQRARNMTSPTASGKLPDGGMTEDIEKKKFVVTTSAAVGVASMNQFAPLEFRKQLKQHAELTNMPRIGSTSNVYFPAIQLNIAPAVAGDESLRKSLEGMGGFGIDHFDKDDDEGGLSTMVSNSDVPEEQAGQLGYEYGRFHLLAFGFYIKLTPFRIMSFSGLFKHGGSPPLSPAGIAPVPWAYRFMIVLYPPESMLSGAGKQIIGLAALPKGKLFQLPPEMTSLTSESAASRGITNEANWANDGIVNTYFLHQLPVHMQARLDPDAFLAAFTMKDTTSDTRVNAGTWETAPNG